MNLNSLIERIRGFFRPAKPEDSDPTYSDRFIFRAELDAIENDPIVGTVVLKAKGEINGGMDMPPSDYDGLDLVELEVVKGYEHLIQSKAAGYRSELLEIERKIASLDPRIFLADGNSSSLLDSQSNNKRPVDFERARSDMETVVTENLGRIRKSRDRASRARDEYLAFKEKNELTTDIELRSGKFKSKNWALLVIVLVTETLINGIFFGGIAGTNFIANGLPAILISSVNVGVFGFLIMRCWKYCSHVRKNLKTWAWIGFMTCCLTVFLFNLGAAHFRDAIPNHFPHEEHRCYRPNPYYPDVGSRPDDPGQEALCLLGHNFARLGQFDSYAFFMLGIGFVILGVIEWGRIFPGYPGHENSMRLFLNAQKSLDEDCDSVRVELRKIYDVATERLQSTVLNHYKLAAALVRCADNKYKDMRGYTDEIAERCCRALEFYRSANRLAREEVSNIPSHWSKKWMPDWALPQPPDDLNLCNSEYAQSLHDKEQQYIENYLDPSYQKSIKKIAEIASYPDTNVRGQRGQSMDDR